MNDLFDHGKEPDPTIFDVIEKGIRESAEHAERVEPGWGDKALEYFRLYATLHPTFLTEAVRDYAYKCGLEEPPAPGAWGHVARRAKKEGYVEQHGFTSSNNASQHGKRMALWVSQIFEQGAQHIRAEQE